MCALIHVSLSTPDRALDQCASRNVWLQICICSEVIFLNLFNDLCKQWNHFSRWFSSLLVFIHNCNNVHSFPMIVEKEDSITNVSRNASEYYHPIGIPYKTENFPLLSIYLLPQSVMQNFWLLLYTPQTHRHIARLALYSLYSAVCIYIRIRRKVRRSMR